MARAGIAEIAVGETQTAQKEYLEEPVENDGDLAEKERRLEIWRCQRVMHVGSDKNVIEQQQRKRQHAGDAKNIQGVGQRNETPLRGGEIEEIADHHAEGDEIRQDAEQQRQTFEKGIAFETQIETRQHRKRGRKRVVHRDQKVPQGEIRETHHFADVYKEI